MLYNVSYRSFDYFRKLSLIVSIVNVFVCFLFFFFWFF